MKDEEVRHDFEVAMLFRAHLMGAKKEGFFKKRANGIYVNERAEMLFQGYRVAREGDAGQLRRYAPDRNIAVGHMNELHDALKSEGLFTVLNPAQVRVVLRVVGGWPV